MEQPVARLAPPNTSLKRSCDFCVKRKRSCDGAGRKWCRWVGGAMVTYVSASCLHVSADYKS